MLRTDSNRARSNRVRARAEALFKKEEQRRNGQAAMAEYEANRTAVQEKTARLRALRLARDAASRTG
jgi:L-serine deaminase